MTRDEALAACRMLGVEYQVWEYPDEDVYLGADEDYALVEGSHIMFRSMYKTEHGFARGILSMATKIARARAANVQPK